MRRIAHTLSHDPIRTDDADDLRFHRLGPVGVVRRIEAITFPESFKAGYEHGALKPQISDLAEGTLNLWRTPPPGISAAALRYVSAVPSPHGPRA